MKVDFYQLDGAASLPSTLAALAGKLLSDDERLLVVSGDEAQLTALDRQLWEEDRAGFLAHGREGGARDKDQPILLSTRTVAANRARHIALVDGEWRPAALDYDRAFMLFDEQSIEAARQAWKDLAGEEDVSRNYWAREDGRWTKRA